VTEGPGVAQNVCFVFPGSDLTLPPVINHLHPRPARNLAGLDAEDVISGKIFFLNFSHGVGGFLDPSWS